MHMLKEVYSTHTIASCHKICITENCKMKNKWTRTSVLGRFRSEGEGRRVDGKGNWCSHFSLSVPRFISSRMYAAMIGSTLLFIFYAKYSVEKVRAVPHSTFNSFSLFRFGFSRIKKNCFMFSYTLASPFSLILQLPPEKCKTCTNLNLFCGQIVWFRSFPEKQKREKKHHTYFLCSLAG